MKHMMFATLAAISLLGSCKKDKAENKQKIFKGPAVTFQHGTAWSWYEVDDKDMPLKIVIAVDDAAMNSLDTLATGAPGHHHENDVILKLHPKASATPFNHIGLGWNPKGHEPEQVYGKPHFDFHFYLPTPEAVAAIPPYEVDSTKFLRTPAPAYFPPTYVNFGGGVPQMGVHWLDVTSPELNGAEFTQTFIYGSYDGAVTFLEPMITAAFIKANPAFERAIPQPAKYQKTSFYPTKMRLEKSNGITNIILENFVYRQAQ